MKPKLAVQPSDVIRQAVEDLKAVEAESAGVIDMGIWLAVKPHLDDPDGPAMCHVCLAGASLLRQWPEQRDVFAESISQALRTGPAQLVREGRLHQADAVRLHMLDQVRLGNVERAAAYVLGYIFPWVDQDKAFRKSTDDFLHDVIEAWIDRSEELFRLRNDTGETGHYRGLPLSVPKNQAFLARLVARADAWDMPPAELAAKATEILNQLQQEPQYVSATV